MPVPIPVDFAGHLGPADAPASAHALGLFLLRQVHDLNNPVGAMVLRLASQQRHHLRLLEAIEADRPEEARQEAE